MADAAVDANQSPMKGNAVTPSVIK